MLSQLKVLKQGELLFVLNSKLKPRLKVEVND